MPKIVPDIEPLNVVDYREFVYWDPAPRTPILYPWVFSQSLLMVHAWRGIGKTYFMLYVAWAISTGTEIFGWRAPSPKRVLYVDGEMPGAVLKERFKAISSGTKIEPESGHLRIITPDLEDGPMPDLATSIGQARLDAVIGDADLVIIDNLSCLVRGLGNENDAESWVGISEWALKHRRAGRSILFVHHSGKGGKQRGTSKREDLLDVVVTLKRPPDYNEEEGAAFEVHFEKSRNAYGDEVAPIEVRLDVDATGKQFWSTRNVTAQNRKRVAELWNNGLTLADIVSEVGIHKSNVVRNLQAANAAGELARPYPPAKKGARS